MQRYKSLKIKLTKRQKELLHGQLRSVSHTGKAVENADAGKCDGGGGNKQPLTEDSLRTTKHAQ